MPVTTSGGEPSPLVRRPWPAAPALRRGPRGAGSVVRGEILLFLEPAEFDGWHAGPASRSALSRSTGHDQGAVHIWVDQAVVGVRARLGGRRERSLLVGRDHRRIEGLVIGGQAVRHGVAILHRYLRARGRSKGRELEVLDGDGIRSRAGRRGATGARPAAWSPLWRWLDPTIFQTVIVDILSGCIEFLDRSGQGVGRKAWWDRN